jgi:reactive intermediate/imine deaminase
MARQAIQTIDAPRAIGAYSQAIRAGNTIYLSGQIGLDPATMTLVEGVDAQIHQVLRNLRTVAEAAGATLDDAVKVTVFLTDMGNFARVNEVMAQFFCAALSRARRGGCVVAAARRRGGDRGDTGCR